MTTSANAPRPKISQLRSSAAKRDGIYVRGANIRQQSSKWKSFATILAQTAVNGAPYVMISVWYVTISDIRAGKSTRYCLSGAHWLWHRALGCCTERDMARDALSLNTVHVALISRKFPTLFSIVRFSNRTFRRSHVALKSNWSLKDQLGAPCGRQRTAFER